MVMPKSTQTRVYSIGMIISTRGLCSNKVSVNMYTLQRSVCVLACAYACACVCERAACVCVRERAAAASVCVCVCVLRLCTLN